MTGFARAQVRVHDQLKYTLSVKSVNHRFLDLHFRLPAGSDRLEMQLRKLLKENIARGHVEVTVSVERGTNEGLVLNRKLVGTYIAAFRAAARSRPRRPLAWEDGGRVTAFRARERLPRRTERRRLRFSRRPARSSALETATRPRHVCRR